MTLPRFNLIHDADSPWKISSPPFLYPVVCFKTQIWSYEQSSDGKEIFGIMIGQQKIEFNSKKFSLIKRWQVIPRVKMSHTVMQHIHTPISTWINGNSKEKNYVDTPMVRKPSWKYIRCATIWKSSLCEKNYVDIRIFLMTFFMLNT